MHINDDKLGDETYQQGLSINRDKNQDKIKKRPVKAGRAKTNPSKKCDIDLTFRDLAKKNYLKPRMYQYYGPGM